MPNAIMKSFAKKADTTVKAVERKWNIAEKLVKKKYELTPDEDSDRFYALVVAVLKKMLKLDEPKPVTEDDGTITTANMGDYKFAQRMGVVQRQKPVTQDEYEVAEKESIESLDAVKLAKRIKKIVDTLNGVNEGTDIFDEYINYFKTKYDDPEIIVEKAIEYIEKKLGIVKGAMDK